MSEEGYNYTSLQVPRNSKGGFLDDNSDEEENGRGPLLRLPLFGRDPLTNKAYLDNGLNTAANVKSQNFMSKYLLCGEPSEAPHLPSI